MKTKYNSIIKNTLYFSLISLFAAKLFADDGINSTYDWSEELPTTQAPSINYKDTTYYLDINDIEGSANDNKRYLSWNFNATTGNFSLVAVTDQAAIDAGSYSFELSGYTSAYVSAPSSEESYIIYGVSRKENGGAMLNNSYAESINAIFVANASAKTGSSNSGNIGNGGGLYNTNVIGELNGLFLANCSSSQHKAAYGGGLWNSSNVENAETGVVGIGLINADFIGNYAWAKTSGNNALGGGIYNIGTIGDIKGVFIANYAYAVTTAYGGAIYNTKSISSIESNFIGNYAKANNAYGGAIFNNSLISSIEANFIGNYTQGSNALGGAIYNGGTSSSLTLSAGEGETFYALGNWAGLNEDSASDANGGFLYAANGKVNFDTIAADSAIVIGNGTQGYDSIAGTINGVINKYGEGSLIVNSSMEYFLGTLNVNEGKMYYTNSAILGAANLIIGDADSSNGTAEFITSASSLGASTTIKEDGILSLFGGTLSQDINTESSALGTVNINSAVIANADIYAGAINVLGNSYLEINDATISGKMTIGSNASSDETELSYVYVDSGSLNSDISLGSAEYAGTARLDITGTVNFDGNDDGFITISGEDAIGKTVLNILSGFVNANQNDTDDYDLYLKDIDFVTIYGNVDIGEIYIDQSSIGDFSQKDFSSSTLLGEIVKDSTIKGSDYLFLGSNNSDKTILDATIYLSDIGNVFSENTSITSDTAFVLSSTKPETSFGGSMDFIDSEDAIDSSIKTAISVDSNSTIAGDVLATYTSEFLAEKLENGEDISTYLKAIESTDGIVNLADNTSVSSSITIDGKTYAGVAITNYHEGDTESSGLNINLEGSASVNGSIVANSPLTISATGVSGSTDDSYLGDSDSNTVTASGSLVVSGGVITTNSTTENASENYLKVDGVNLVLTTNSQGNMASFENVGNILTENGASLSISASASMLVGATYDIADETTLANNSDLSSSITTSDDLNLSFSEENNTLSATVDSLSYFESKADSANESALASALDSLAATDNADINSSLIDFKNYVDAAGVDSFIMDNYSYVSELNSMLLSNLNYANTNRARSILAKLPNTVKYHRENSGNAASYLQGEDRIAEIPYSKVAQLQSINLLGSKNASNGVAGYDYVSVGSTANIDALLSDTTIAGISIGGTYNKVSGDAGDNANSTAFLFNAYGAVKSGIYPFEVFANIGYAHFFNDISKGGASAEFDSDAFNALAGIAFDFETGLDGLKIKPLAMLNMVLLNNEASSYSNGIEIDEQSYISAKAMLGLELEYAITPKLNTSLKAIYAYELADDSYDFDYSFANGIFKDLSYTGGNTGKNSALLGLGISYDFARHCTLYLDYNAIIYESMLSHSLNLSIALKF